MLITERLPVRSEICNCRACAWRSPICIFIRLCNSINIHGNSSNNNLLVQGHLSVATVLSTFFFRTLGCGFGWNFVRGTQRHGFQRLEMDVVRGNDLLEMAAFYFWRDGEWEQVLCVVRT